MPRQLPWAQALRNTRNGLFVVDRSQRVLSWNRAEERLFGHAATDVVGCHCYDVVAGRLASGRLWCRPNCGVQRSVRQGRLLPAVEIAVLTKERRTVWLDVACFVLPGKPAPLVAHLLRDITAEKHHEEELDRIRTIMGVGGGRSRPGGEQREMPGAPAARPAADPVELESAKRLATLSARERSVLRLLADGLSGKSIAARLGISVLTVRSHVANVLRKLGVHRQAAAVAVALREEASPEHVRKFPTN